MKLYSLLPKEPKEIIVLTFDASIFSAKRRKKYWNNGLQNANHQTKVRFFHQGYELYGSDKVLLQTIVAIKKYQSDWFVSAIIPRDGQLKEQLMKVADEVIVNDFFVARKASMKNFGLVLSLFSFMKTLLVLPSLIKEQDIVYVNSCTLLAHLAFSRFSRKKFIFHFHEIPTGISKIVINLFSLFSKGDRIFISKACKDACDFKHKVSDSVILNGVDGLRALKKNFTNKTRTKILMIGRLNEWKGQDLLLEAFSDLTNDEAGLYELKIVGSSFEDNPKYISHLERLVDANNLNGIVSLLPFQDDPQRLYHWADIVIIPSKKPEPFGLVAIEAMSVGCLVIGSNAGGLKEIIKHGYDGLLFSPNDKSDLLRQIRLSHSDPVYCSQLAANGYETFQQNFNVEAFERKIISKIKKVFKSDS